jgi:hypothetical protein
MWTDSLKKFLATMGLLLGVALSAIIARPLETKPRLSDQSGDNAGNTSYMLHRNDIGQSDSYNEAYSIRPPLNRAVPPSEAWEVD